MGKLGGFYGIFIWNLDSVNIDICVNKEEVDLLDVLDLNNFSEIEIPAIDIGDPDKYQESLRIVDRPIRSFNKIIVGENSVTKICNDEILKNAEENWYKEMQDLKFIPRVFSYDPLILQKINGEQRFDIIKPLYKLAKKIHKSKSTISSNPNDCWNMYIYKTIKRLELIDYLFPFKDCFGVNGIFCKNPVERLKKIDITKFIPEKFTPIHGDLTTSNVLWDGRKPYIIDPRGIFGESFLYGDPDYDIAKIYYSSTGWHLLNKGALIPVIKSLNEFKINDIEKYKDDKINFLLAIIWLSVAEYVKSNTLSSLYAYLTGSYLLERWLLDNE
jgi:thiamine kinase-like enzyme